MAQDISNLAINASFQSLVQVSSSAEGNMLATATGTDFIVATASYALNSENQESASYALSASVADFATNADTANEAAFATNATSASYSLVASSATTATSASFSENARTADSATSASFSEDARTADSSFSATSASYAEVAGAVLGTIDSASFAENARTADSATSASVAISSSFASTASLALRNLLSATNDFSEITFTKGDGTTLLVDATPRQVIELVKNADVTTLVKGTPVYVSGSTGNAANVYKADASNANRMPAAFILEQTLDPLEEGIGILSGFINAVSTIGFEDGDEVYVAAGGGYTNVRPTGTNQVQKLGNIINGQSINGSGVITGAGQQNNLPNLPTSHVWVGNGSQQGTAVLTSSLSVGNAVSASRAVSASIADDIKEGIDVSFNSGSFNDIVANTLAVTNFTAVTSSVVITGDAYIQLNNDTPVQRYAGITVRDSGSNTTASFEFDGQTNDWFYDYEGDDPTNFGVVMFGPEYGTKGSPIYPSANTILKGNGGHHVLDSIITDDGSLVSVAGNLTANVITANTNFAGNLVGNADTATTASHALTAASATSASFAQTSAVAVSSSFATFTPTALSASFAENSAVAVSASFSEDARTADSATSASFAQNSAIAVSSSFAEDARTADSATTASHALSIPGVITNDVTFNGSVNGGVNALSIASNTASLDMSAGNFFTLAMPAGGAVHINATNIQAGQTINLRTTQNATPSTLDWNSEFKFESGSIFAASTGSGVVDLMSFVTFDTSNVLGTGINNLV